MDSKMQPNQSEEFSNDSISTSNISNDSISNVSISNDSISNDSISNDSYYSPLESTEGSQTAYYKGLEIDLFQYIFYISFLKNSYKKGKITRQQVEEKLPEMVKIAKQLFEELEKSGKEVQNIPELSEIYEHGFGF